MINVSRLMTSSNFAESYIIHRSTKASTWTKGGKFESVEEIIKTIGPVQPASDDDLQQIPEGDRNKRVLTFWNKNELHITDDTTVSDRIEYKGKMYKISGLASWDSYGFSKAIAVMEG